MRAVVRPSNTELEQRWIDAWEALHTALAAHPGAVCALPDGAEVTRDGAQHWLQQRAYEGRVLTVAVGWLRGRRAVLLGAMGSG